MTVTITAMCQFAVRHTCVWCACPSGPVLRRACPFHQSQKPVVAVASETTPPAIRTIVPATKKSCATAPGCPAGLPRAAT